ncbi:MAG: hypothetical protein WC612_02725 [Bdellovibrionales bacterium]|jgi:hypothetical protein
MTATRQHKTEVTPEDIAVARYLKRGMLVGAFISAAESIVNPNIMTGVATALTLTVYAIISLAQAADDASKNERRQQPSLGTRWKSYFLHPLR